MVKSHVYRYSTDGTIWRALLKFTEGYDNNSNRAGRITPESLAGRSRIFHVTYSISWDIALMAPILVQFEDGTNQFNDIDFTQLPNCYPSVGLPVDYEQLNRIKKITEKSVPKPFDDCKFTNLLPKQIVEATSDEELDEESYRSVTFLSLKRVFSYPHCRQIENPESILFILNLIRNLVSLGHASSNSVKKIFFK